MRKTDPDRVFEGNEIDLRGERVDPHLFRRVGENIVLKARSSGTPSPQIVVGGDTRHDTQVLIESLSKGILHRGGSIILVGGDIAKPVIYFSGQHYSADAVAYVTASHVRSNFNGAKICFLERAARQKPVLSLAAREVVNKRDDVVRGYEEYLAKTFGPELGKGMHLVVDSLFGSSRLIAPEVLRKSRFTLECLHGFVDRKFTQLHDNAPDPTLPKNLEELQEVTKLWEGIGMAFDGDMDRVVFVDEEGEVVSADEIAMILARYILKRLRKKSKVVYQCQSSNSLPEVIKQARGRPVIQETGWQNIKRKMQEVKGAFGSEISGHFFYGRDLYCVSNGDDGLYTALMLCKVLKEMERSLVEARKALPAYFTSPELRVTYDRNRRTRVIEALEKHFKGHDGYTLNVIGQDIRAEKHEGKQWCLWLVFRTSSTEPDKLSFRFEGRTLAHLAEAWHALLDAIPQEDHRLKTLLDDTYKDAVGDPTAYYRKALEAAGKI
jgi:phosphomannomutase/phosphoglucomutase